MKRIARTIGNGGIALEDDELALTIALIGKY
jgi:hypothetical protein